MIIDCHPSPWGWTPPPENLDLPLSLRLAPVPADSHRSLTPLTLRLAPVPADLHLSPNVFFRHSPKYSKGTSQFLLPTDNLISHLLIYLNIQIMKKTATMWEYRVGINVIIANFVRL